MERPDIRIEARTANHITMVSNLYSNNPTTDFFVAARLPSLPVVPALTSVINANKDIISFPLAASAVVPIYNLPSLDRAVPLLLSRTVSTGQGQGRGQGAIVREVHLDEYPCVRCSLFFRLRLCVRLGSLPPCLSGIR